jgi:DNA-binding MarR family transcriptional regulator
MPSMTPEPPADVLTSRLGYLLKHVHHRLVAEGARALAPYGIDGRELAVLALVGAHEGLSQLEAASRLGIDRTTMVALLDALEAKSLVARHRDPHDRRRNTVALTPTGADRLRDAEAARAEVERRFLSPLPEAEAARFVAALRTLEAAPPAAD